MAASAFAALLMARVSQVSATYLVVAGGGSGGNFGGGGAGGGGAGSRDANATAGTANTGGGGGGAGRVSAANFNGGSGGSGIVVVRYPIGMAISAVGGTVTTVGPYRVHTYTSTGTFSFVA